MITGVMDDKGKFIYITEVSFFFVFHHLFFILTLWNYD
jgi:hypothetical protein